MLAMLIDVSVEYVGRRDIAEMLGVSRQRAHELTQRHNFPRPVGQINRQPVWRREDVETWAKETGRSV
jgi:predicted DNA-binding transcriptional regulator AlpA